MLVSSILAVPQRGDAMENACVGTLNVVPTQEIAMAILAQGVDCLDGMSLIEVVRGQIVQTLGPHGFTPLPWLIGIEGFSLLTVARLNLPDGRRHS